MSLLYSVLKPIARKAIKSKVHQEETWEDFVRVSYDVQAKFKFALPEIKGCEFRDEIIDGCHCLIGRKSGTKPTRALMYLVGGGERRWQLPLKKSMARFINETGRELWIPLYPLYPDHDITDEIRMISETHRAMLERYSAGDIAWLGFSAGADLIMSAGRSLVRACQPLPMPGLMIPVSCCNLHYTQATYDRMLEIEKRDIMMHAADMLTFAKFYDRENKLPDWVWGNAETDDYTGFPKIVMYFGGDEIFAAAAPDYEAAFKRCGVKDYTIHVEPGLFHAYPMFTFVPEGKKGEDEIIEYLK